jgi:hypothetical protein
MDLGVIDLVDGTLDLVVDDDETQAWMIIHGFEFIPVEGQFITPALDLADFRRIHGREANARARAFAELPTGCSVLFERRTATVRDGQPQWAQWAPMPEAVANFGEPFPLAGDLLQFRLTLTYERGAQPAIVDVKVQIVPSQTRASTGQ